MARHQAISEPTTPIIGSSRTSEKTFYCWVTGSIWSFVLHGICIGRTWECAVHHACLWLVRETLAMGQSCNKGKVGFCVYSTFGFCAYFNAGETNLSGLHTAIKGVKGMSHAYIIGR